MRAVIIALPILLAFVVGYLVCRWQMRQRPELSKTKQEELNIRRTTMYEIQAQVALNFHEPLAVIINDELRKAEKQFQELEA